MHRPMNRRQFIALSAPVLLPLPCAAEPRAGTHEPPPAPFGPYSTAEEVTSGIDLSGKTVVITGCNSGIGLETMRVLALRGAHVLGTARTVEKGQAAVAGVHGQATPLVLELSNFDSVVACSNQVRKLDVPVDVVICNAGVLLPSLETVYGLERQFVVNYLGHFLLVHRLLEQIRAAPQGRVVVVGSVSHFEAPSPGIQFDDLSGRGWARWSYGHSKLADGLFSLELSRRLRHTRATSNCLNPGGVKTRILRYFNFPEPTGNYRFKTPAEGAATSCYLASAPALAKVSGYYFEDGHVAPQSDFQRDPVMARRLWEVSEHLTRRYLA